MREMKLASISEREQTRPKVKNEFNGITGQTIRRMDGLQMKSMHSRGDHPRLMKACRFVFARPEECVLGQCSLASPMEYTF